MQIVVEVECFLQRYNLTIMNNLTYQDKIDSGFQIVVVAGPLYLVLEFKQLGDQDLRWLICCNALKNSRQRQRQRQTQKKNNEFGQFSRQLTETLLWLPLKSVFQCKCISNRWCSLISTPYFTRRFVGHHHTNLEPSTLLFESADNQSNRAFTTDSDEPEFKLSLLMYTDTMSLKICVMTCSYGASGLKMKMRCLVR